MAQSNKRSNKQANKRSSKRSSAKMSSNKVNSGSTHRWLPSWGTLFKLASVMLVIAVLALAYTDAVVTQKFDGKRWSLPSKVFARPLTLFEGANIRFEDVKWELQQLGYRQTSNASQPGEFSILSGRSLVIYLREFTFWDEVQPEARIRLEFSAQRIEGMKADQSAVRMEPIAIGGIYPLHHEDRVLMQLEGAPAYLEQALLLVEDRRFYAHHGVSLRGIMRAVMVNLGSGRMRQGGSTLTQQLVKNFYLTSERTLKRKAIEAVMAILLEAHYSKQDILEAYFNEIYLGQRGETAVHGFALASYFYFARPINELTLPEVALLVGMVKGPSYYNPRRYPKRALDRRNVVLDMMEEHGAISHSDAIAARNAPLNVSEKPRLAGDRYPAFMDLVKLRLRERYQEDDLRAEGLKIFTTLNPLVQRQAQRALTDHVNQIKNTRNGYEDLEGAVVVSQPLSGDILGLVSSKRDGFSGFNRALYGRRPIGSLVKPAVYLAALSQPQKYNLATPISDAPISLHQTSGTPWQPANFDKRSHGDIPDHQVSMREALAKSYNLASVNLGLDVGVETVIDTLRLLGVKNNIAAYPSLFVGSLEMSPIEVGRMMNTIANGGLHSTGRAVLAVTTAEGVPLAHYDVALDARIDAAPIYLTTTLMQSVVQEGTARAANLPAQWQAAGKTGTSDEGRDAWFAGFTGNHSAVVWVGFDDNRATSLTGGSGALPVWKALMQQLPQQPLSNIAPVNVAQQWVSADGKYLSAEHCAGAQYIPLIDGSLLEAQPNCDLEQRAPVTERVKKWWQRLF